MSRPRESRPSGKSRPGGVRAGPNCIVMGECSTMNGANSAAAANSTNSTAPDSPSRWRRNRRNCWRPVLCRTRTRARLAGFTCWTPILSPDHRPSLVADARVDDSINEIAGQAAEHEEEAQDERHALDDRKVPHEDGTDQERSHPRQTEDLLDDDRPGEQVHEVDRGNGDDGDERVPQRVF